MFWKIPKEYHILVQNLIAGLRHIPVDKRADVARAINEFQEKLIEIFN